MKTERFFILTNFNVTNILVRKIATLVKIAKRSYFRPESPLKHGFESV